MFNRVVKLSQACALAVCLSGLGTMAIAKEAAVSVEVNMARILRISAPASTVIIGNPGIADVTIQDATTLIITGKSYGFTNLIILDASGNPVADTIVEVVQQSGTGNLVTIYMGAARNSVMCSPVCQPVIMIGDDPGFTAQTISSSALVEDAAQ